MSKSATTIDMLPNPTPGEILLEEFLKPLDLSQTALARALFVPPGRILAVSTSTSAGHRLIRNFAITGR